MDLMLFIQFAGLLHFGLLGAGATMPRVVGLRTHLRAVPPFIGQLVWVYYSFIGLCLIGFGAVSWFFADTLASGTPLARAICGFLCAFWSLRLIAALWVFDVRPYLRNPWLRLGYHATNIVFAVMPVIYGRAALRGIDL